jgi:hypothetical protein
MKIYSFKVKWYFDATVDYEERQDKGLVVAESMSEAVEKIEDRFPQTDTVDIHLVDEDDFIFVTDEVYEKLQGDDYTSGEYIIGE